MSSPVGRRWPLISAIGAAALAAAVLAIVLRQPESSQPEPPPVAPPVAQDTVTTTPPPKPAIAALPESAPETLEVPAIDVRTGPIIELGLDAAGALEVPGDATTTGWYRGSPTPGELGPAILAGHVNYNHAQGVFSRLNELRPGDQAIVHRADGTTAVFTIYQVDSYAKSAFPTDKVYGNTTTPELRLITCGGAYDAENRNYLDNVVAYARMA